MTPIIKLLYVEDNVSCTAVDSSVDNVESDETKQLPVVCEYPMYVKVTLQLQEGAGRACSRSIAVIRQTIWQLSLNSELCSNVRNAHR
ncbi:hypothetical protein J6590_013864 [Homalodisca vitripennis]|nr:hypothetical protein J6590_013864 [Homalodisca vitripennis]